MMLKELSKIYNHMKNNIETMKKKLGIKNTISDIKNTLEEIKSKLDDAKDKVSNLEKGKNTQSEEQKEKKIKKNEGSLRELRDNVNQNNIHMIGLREGEEKE